MNETGARSARVSQHVEGVGLSVSILPCQRGTVFSMREEKILGREEGVFSSSDLGVLASP